MTHLVHVIAGAFAWILGVDARSVSGTLAVANQVVERPRDGSHDCEDTP